MHVYNRLIISSDGFAIILKTSIINFFHVMHCYFTFCTRAHAPPLAVSSAFQRSLVLLLMFFGFQDEKGSKCNHAHRTHTLTLMLLRHEWFTHIQSTNEKNAFTHIGMQFKIIYSNCIICGAVFHAYWERELVFFSSGSACREMARAKENRREPYEQVNNSQPASQPVNQCMNCWCRFHCVSNSSISNSSRCGLVNPNLNDQSYANE